MPKRKVHVFLYLEELTEQLSCSIFLHASLVLKKERHVLNFVEEERFKVLAVLVVGSATTLPAPCLLHHVITSALQPEDTRNMKSV